MDEDTKIDNVREDDTEKKEYVPLGVFTFEDLDRIKDTRRAARAIEEASDELMQIVRNIVMSPDVADKERAIAAAASEFSGRLKSMSRGKGVIKKVIGDIKDRITSNDAAPPERTLVVFKDGAGEFRWVTAYSNNFRDDDHPPEIISGGSHREFVKMVDDGEAELPELWLWHEKSLKVGNATWVGVDELDGGVVVALAAGHFDDDKQWVAAALEKSGVDGVSHGMPVDRIVRDEKDGTIIVGHVTTEISALPRSRAANKLAGFEVIEKESNMAITEEKRRQLQEALSIDDDAIAAIEESNKARAQKGVDAELELKGGDVEVDIESGDATADTDTKDDVQEEDTVAVLTGVVADAVEKALTKSVYGPVGDALKTLAERIGALEEQDEERVAKTIEETPAAAFNGLLGTIINQKAAEVEPGSELAEAKPKEASVEHESGHSGFVTSLWENK